jgi:hypothetical protein
MNSTATTQAGPAQRSAYRGLLRSLACAFTAIGLVACGGGGSGSADSSAGGGGGAAATVASISAQPTGTSVAAGQGASFSVVASGTAPFTYQWRRDGADLPGATAATYTLAVVSAADNGAAFSVVVSNAAGSVTSAAAILSVTGTATAQGSPSFVLAERAVDVTPTGSGNVQSYHTSISVYDPKVASPVASVDFGSSTSGPSGQPGWASESVEVDRATRRSTYQGQAMLVYALAGKIYKIDLLAGASHAPQQVSSVTDACFSVLEWQLDPAGRTAWLPVGYLVNGLCSANDPATGQPAGRFVHTDMPATKPPVTVPGVAGIVATLDDGARTAIGMLMRVNGRYEFRSVSDLTRIAVVASPPPGNLSFVGYDYATLQAIFWRAGDSLVRLSWTATGATFSAPIYTFASDAADQAGILNASDGTALYFSDQTRLLKVAGTAAPVAVTTLAGSTPVFTIFVTSTHVVATQSARSSSVPISTTLVPKAGGTPTLIADAYAMGVAEGALVYGTLPQASTHVVNLDGSQDRSIPALAHLVYQASRLADQYLVDSLLLCRPTVASDGRCSNGDLLQLDLSLTKTTLLGSVTHAAAAAADLNTFEPANLLSNAPLVAGLPSLATVSGALPADANGLAGAATDYYAFVPGQAGSLLRLSNLLP